MTDAELIEHAKIRMIAAECSIRNLTGSAANLFPIPGTLRVIAMGTREDLAKLMADDVLPAVAAEVPAAWKLVPVEPTQNMFEAARTSASGSAAEKSLMASYYRAMLAAAPTPPAPATVAADEILSLHRRLSAETLRADQGWKRAEAKSRECIELRERLAASSVARDRALSDERIKELTFGIYQSDYQDNPHGYDIAIARAIECAIRTAPSEAGKGGES